MNSNQLKYSQDQTTRNVDFVREQIANKMNYNIPYYASNSLVTNSVTDMDHFPYNRFYRGIPTSDKPVVLDREAGFRELHNTAYNPNIILPLQDPPSLCWEAACSTVYPCYPEYLRKYADKNELEIMLNKKCIIKSP